MKYYYKKMYYRFKRRNGIAKTARLCKSVSSEEVNDDAFSIKYRKQMEWGIRYIILFIINEYWLPIIYFFTRIAIDKTTPRRL